MSDIINNQKEKNRVTIKGEKTHFAQCLNKFMIKYDEKIPDLVKSIFGKSEKCFKNDESKQDGDHSHEYSQVSNWKRGLALPNHEDYKKVKKHYQDKGEHISNFEFLYSNTPQKY
ncbi:MAG: hypothetical protein ABF643_08345, partial [Oenococcus oeni]